MAEAVRDSHILMRYRDAPEERERALTSGPLAVKDWLGRFESLDDFAKAATLLAVALGSAVDERLGEDSISYYTASRESQMEFPIDPVEAERAEQGLQWLSKLAGVEGTIEAGLARQ